MVKSNLDFFILKLYQPLQSCCCLGGINSFQQNVKIKMLDHFSQSFLSQKYCRPDISVHLFYEFQVVCQNFLCLFATKGIFCHIGQHAWFRSSRADLTSAFSLWFSTCLLVLGCWEMSHMIFLMLRKKELLVKLSKFTNRQLFSLKMGLGNVHKGRPIFGQVGISSKIGQNGTRQV